jgi:single-stranded DNA-binding protein
MTEISFQTTGNLTADPELRFTPRRPPSRQPHHRGYPAGQGHGRLRATARPRSSGVPPLGRPAENIAESLTRGARSQRRRGFSAPAPTTDREGETRHVLEATFDTVSPDLQFATVKVSKTSRAARQDGLPGPVRGHLGHERQQRRMQYHDPVQAARESASATQPV